MNVIRKIRCKTPSPHRIDSFGVLVIDYSLERPFESWLYEDIHECLDVILSHEKPNLEIPTLMTSELTSRGANVSEARGKIMAADCKVIPWLKAARFRIQNHVDAFVPSSEAPKINKVYVILLTNDLDTPEPWGVYLGQTSKKIEKRLAVHLDENNKHGSPKVRKRGWQLIYSLCSIIPTMTREDSCRFEGILLDSLMGNLNFNPLKKLPMKRVKGAGPAEYRVKNKLKALSENENP